MSTGAPLETVPAVSTPAAPSSPTPAEQISALQAEVIAATLAAIEAKTAFQIQHKAREDARSNHHQARWRLRKAQQALAKLLQ